MKQIPSFSMQLLEKIVFFVKKVGKRIKHSVICNTCFSLLLVIHGGIRCTPN